MQLRQFGRFGDGVVNDFQWNVALGNTRLEDNQPSVQDASVVLIILNVRQFLALLVYREGAVAALRHDIVTDNGTAEVITAVFATLVRGSALIVAVILIELGTQLERDRYLCHRRLVQQNLCEDTMGDRKSVV